MEKRRLGNSDLEITPVGFGAWAIGGGGWEYGWGPQDDQESISAIQRAVHVGINWIDTAAIYGLGHSEEVVAHALKMHGGTHRPYVFTKCVMVWNEKREVSFCMKRDSLRRELEASLRRLQVEAIDLYQIHWPNPDADIEEGWSTLAEFQKEGKVRWIGVSNFSVEQMKRAQAIAPITSLQPPYSMLRRDVEKEILPFCLENNIGVIVYSPMLSGMLTGAMTRERAAGFAGDDWRRKNKEFQEPRLSKNLELVEALGAIGKPHGVSPGTVAVAWTLRHPAVTGAIVGARSARQVDGTAQALSFRLNDAELAQIEDALRANAG